MSKMEMCWWNEDIAKVKRKCFEMKMEHTRTNGNMLEWKRGRPSRKTLRSQRREIARAKGGI